MPAPDAAIPDQELQALTAELRLALAPGIHLLEPFAAGGMGRVFLGRDPLLKRQVAIKVLSPALADDATARARFVREAEASAAVSHPNVVGIHLVGELPASRIPYFVMQYIEGRSLADEVATRAGMSESRARRIIGEVASALAAAHARGLVHRDIKPANIMIEAETERPVVLDFGISAILERGPVSPQAKLTQAGTYLGTPTYMSPEQATGEPITEKSDVYSLGAVAFELLAGRPPFEGQSLVVMAAHVKDTPPALHGLRPDVDPHLGELVDRCLAKDPARRPTAADVAQSLLPSARTVVEWPPPGLEPLRGEGARVARGWAALCAGVLLFFVLLASQPTMASPRWNVGEESALWSRLVSPGAALVDEQRRNYRWASDQPAMLDASPIWLFLLGGSLAVVIVLAPFVALQSETVTRKALHGRRAGYPAATLLDVAWDESGDVGAMLNASGRFALVAPQQRTALLRMHRYRALITLVAPSLTILACLLWTAGAAGGNPAGELMPGRDLLVLFTPTLAGLIGISAIDRRRWALAGKVARSRRQHPARTIDTRLVSSWLTAAGHPQSPVRARSELARRWLVRLLAPLSLLALTYATFIVFLAAFIATALTSRGKGDAQRWMMAQKADSTRPLRWRELDSLVARSAVRSAGVVDSQAARLLLGRGLLNQWPGRHGGVFDSDTAGARRVGRVEEGVAALTDLPGVLLAIEKGRPLTRQQLDILTFEQQSDTRWMAIWRRFARSEPPQPFWMYRAGLPGVRYDWEVPILAFRVMRELGNRNLAAGYTALFRGNAAEAELRARENIAAGRNMYGAGTLIEELRGITLIQRGATQLEVIARRSGDARLAAEGAALKSVLQRWRTERLSFPAWLALFADPVDPVGLRYVNADRAPSTSSELVGLIGLAACLNAREVLFGMHAGRRDVVRRLAVASGVPRMPELARLAEQWLHDVEQGPPTARLGTVRDYLKPLGWFGLTGLRNRISDCYWSRTFG